MIALPLSHSLFCNAPKTIILIQERGNTLNFHISRYKNNDLLAFYWHSIGILLA